MLDVTLSIGPFRQVDPAREHVVARGEEEEREREGGINGRS